MRLVKLSVQVLDRRGQVQVRDGVTEMRLFGRGRAVRAGLATTVSQVPCPHYCTTFGHAIYPMFALVNLGKLKRAPIVTMDEVPPLQLLCSMAFLFQNSTSYVSCLR